MKSLSRRYVIIGVLTLIFVLGGGYYVTLKMLWSKAGSVVTYKNEIISANYIKQFAQIMFSSYENSREDILLLKTFFVQKQGEVEFIEYLEQTARSQGLEIVIDTINIDSPKNIGTHGMEYFIINFTVKGLWSRVFNFSQILEVIPYAKNIQSMALIQETGDGADIQQGGWKGVYTIKVLKKK